jgi:CRP-like cAMP-binding protein
MGFGERLEDRGEIGVGGMCTVHRAWDSQLQREVALKVLLPERAGRPGATARFLEEAQLTAQLDHPHVVPVHDLGVTPDGRVFFTMKRVEGRTLQDLLDSKDFALSDARALSSVLRILLKTCDAVACAHSRGVIHLDLKPLNVMVGTHGQVHVMDWGIARRLSDLRRDPGPNRVTGTRGYMAPEQARGEVSALDERSDVFSLGAILYRILAGIPPHGELSGDQALARMREGELPAPDELARTGPLPRRLVSICVKATRAAPEDRYPTVEPLQEELESFLTGAARFPTAAFPAGREIIREGDAGEVAFIIVRGRCQAFKGHGARRQLLRTLERGDIFGETAILTGGPRSASIVALEDTALAVVSREALEEELGRSPIGAQAIHALAERFSDLDARATALSAKLAAAELRAALLSWVCVQGEGPPERRAASWSPLAHRLCLQGGLTAGELEAQVSALPGVRLDLGADRVELALRGPGAA